MTFHSEQEFEALFDDPHEWLRQAYQMLEAARVLYEKLQWAREQSKRGPHSECLDTSQRVGYFKGALLLVGFSAENALKALIVHQAHSRQSEGQLSLAIFGPDPHDLTKLCDIAGFELRPFENQLLQRLSTVIKWAGRYRLPKNEAQFEDAKRADPLQLSYPSDLEIIESVLNQVQQTIEDGFEQSS